VENAVRAFKMLGFLGPLGINFEGTCSKFVLTIDSKFRIPDELCMSRS
jgi:hypothetical protein